MLKPQESPSPWALVLAWGVHLYTAMGAVLGFLALAAAFRADYFSTFALLAAALVIDASDGTMARKLRVKQVVPWVDGELLDNIVDYLCYVVVPVAVMMQPGILPDGLQYLALLVLLASAYGFAQTDAKGFVEHYFQGFPSYWNVVAFYFVVLDSDPQLNLAVMLLLVVLVFVPMRWLYPARMEGMRTLTIVLGIAWGVVCLVMLSRLPHPSPTLALLSLFYPVYYTVGSVIYHLRS